MANVEFDENNGLPAFTSRSIIGSPQVPGMAAWLMKKGIIKQESQAKNVLLTVVGVNFFLTIVIFYFFVF